MSPPRVWRHIKPLIVGKECLTLSGSASLRKFQLYQSPQTWGRRTWRYKIHSLRLWWALYALLCQKYEYFAWHSTGPGNIKNVGMAFYNAGHVVYRNIQRERNRYEDKRRTNRCGGSWDNWIKRVKFLLSLVPKADSKIVQLDLLGGGRGLLSLLLS